MVFIYCRTSDDLKQVGQFLCRANSVTGNNSDNSWVVNESDDDCWVIATTCNLSTAGMLSRVRDDVICIEVDDDCAPKVIEPLIKKYGFDNLKWLLTK
ncbi:MAG: hypothetical protein CW716_12100 [Candidatus Bathyarchaeum sp.]|nr:MAG: hypothetical protein CW716_12100 [Candidatus Bathyarchaeum sp.]